MQERDKGVGHSGVLGANAYHLLRSPGTVSVGDPRPRPWAPISQVC